ncbi:hypothetical protein ACFO5S_20440 [Flavobacterium branchiicola]|uniref:Uncharacterized protein n=2 Tax=Flavobacterium branchiicola TaxID=1114875 RepID=A0ABV9PMM1_9FLAO
MGLENPELKITGIAHLSFYQEVIKNKIHNTIITHSQTLETDSNDLKPGINETNFITNISKKNNLTRDYSGKIIHVDKKALTDDWEFWKKNKIQDVIPEEYKQKKFIKKYESGLAHFEEGLQNSLSHTLLLPQIYDVLYDTNRYENPTSSTKRQVSKLIDDLSIEYCFYPFYIKEEKDMLIMCFETRISNKNQILEKLLPLYKQNKDFSIENYEFKIITKYFLDPASYKINYAELNLTEKMHDNLSYSVTINLSEKEYDIEPLKNMVLNVNKDKTYSKEDYEGINRDSKKETQFDSALEIEKAQKDKSKESIIMVILITIILAIIILFLIYG